jgi:hypothetical protein
MRRKFRTLIGVSSMGNLQEVKQSDLQGVKNDHERGGTFSFSC